MTDSRPDYSTLLAWFDVVARQHPLPWHHKPNSRFIISAKGCMVAECASRDVAHAIVSAVQALPLVVERMNRAEALDMTLIECAECGKGTRRREMLEHGTRGLLCLECCDRLFELTPFPVIEPDK